MSKDISVSQVCIHQKLYNSDSQLCNHYVSTLNHMCCVFRLSDNKAMK